MIELALPPSALRQCRSLDRAHLFHRIFTCRHLRELHRSTPMRAERDRYLSHLLDEGRCHPTLQSIARHLLRAGEILALKPGEWATDSDLQRMGEQWNQACLRGQRNRAMTPQYVRNFIFNTRRWLEFLGRMRTKKNASGPFTDILEEFIEANRTERGLAEVTLERYRVTLRPFLAWCSTQIGSNLRKLKLTHIDGYLRQPNCVNWSRPSIACHVGTIRVLLRWLGQRGFCAPELANCVRAPRIYTHERYPLGPTWSQVQQLIASVDTKDTRALRDRAMLLLLAVYGLRSGEVRNLQLEDIDWENAMLHPARPKQRRVSVYPLSRRVGEAIIAYLKVRPACRCRAVFVTERQPYRPLGTGGMTGMVLKRQKALGQVLRHYGPHGLRHACATYLLAEGFTLKQIGDQLGHTMIRATEAYAKVDLKALAQVGDVAFLELVECDRRCAETETPFYEAGSMDGLRAVAELPLKGLT